MNNEATPKTNRKAYRLMQSHPLILDGKVRATGMHASTEERAIARCKTLTKQVGGVWTWEENKSTVV